MAAKCTGCGKYVSSTGVAACSTCPSVYHKGCVGLTDTFTVGKEWVCPECNKKKTRKGDNSGTPVRNISGSNPQASDIAPVPLQRPAPSRDATRACMLRLEEPQAAVEADEVGVRGLRRELSDCMAELREFRKEMSDLRASFAGINARMDTFEQRIETLEKRRMPALETVAELERTVTQLKLELNDRDQESLQADLEIGHLPEEKGENILHTVLVLGAKLGVSMEDRDVVYAERVGVLQGAAAAGEEPRARRIVVRLARRDLRDRLLQAARVRRTLSVADAGRATVAGHRNRIFLNERLTRLNRQLFHRVREECRKLQWRYSWTKRGRIYTRQADGKPAHSIRTEEDFARVFVKTLV